MTLIDNNKQLLGATSRFGYPIKTYDDGFGPLWVYRDSLGIRGIVRAQTWHDAYECVLDEILPAIDQDELDEALCSKCKDEDSYSSSCPECHGNVLLEGYQYMPNAGDTTGIVSIDLNGEYLDELTPELVEELEITLKIEEWDAVHD